MAENYMRVRVIEIEPKGRIVKITGKNGQGKTSAVDSLMVGLLGRKAQKDKPVRLGAKAAKIHIALGTEHVELELTRTITPEGNHTLVLQSKDGTRFTRPQEMLDALMGEGVGDPLEFMRLKPKEQAERLRKLAKVEIDFEQIAAENKADYDERAQISKEMRGLEAEALNITVQPGLPKERVDDAAIMAELSEVSANNEAERKVERERTLLENACARCSEGVAAAQRAIAQAAASVARLKEQLRKAEEDEKIAKMQATKADAQLEQAKAAYEAAPEPRYIDAAEITARLQQAQTANREIDKRERRTKIEDRARTLKRKVERLTMQMEDREATKLRALREAKLPVDGVEITEDGVLYKSIPLNQLGEAEQLRICASIFMAGDPKLRIMPIWHGEALDQDNMAMLADLCEANDFQVVMAMVDSSGKVGIVMEDGQVAAENE